MKKYIKTYDNLIDEAKLAMSQACLETNPEYVLTHHGYIKVFESFILAQADTIEELCDEFVVWNKGWPRPLTHSIVDSDNLFYLSKYIYAKRLASGEECWFKLAIWTDQGLIYVAKMNEKGELELL